MFRFLTATQALYESLRDENTITDKRCIFKLLERNKGTNIFKRLLGHEDTQIDDFKSTAYWRRHIDCEIPTRLFAKSFKAIANFDVIPKVKEHLLKMRHAISGTNKLLAQMNPSLRDHCTFCKINNNNLNPCTTGGLEQVLFGCVYVRRFLEELISTPTLLSFNISLNVVHRLVFQEIRNSSQQITNQIQMLINNYLRECSMIKTMPTPLGCAKRLQTWFTPVLHRQSKTSPCSDIAQLLIDLELFIDQNTD